MTRWFNCHNIFRFFLFAFCLLWSFSATTLFIDFEYKSLLILGRILLQFVVSLFCVLLVTIIQVDNLIFLQLGTAVATTEFLFGWFLEDNDRFAVVLEHALFGMFCCFAGCSGGYFMLFVDVDVGWFGLRFACWEGFVCYRYRKTRFLLRILLLHLPLRQPTINPRTNKTTFLHLCFTTNLNRFDIISLTIRPFRRSLCLYLPLLYLYLSDILGLIILLWYTAVLLLGFLVEVVITGESFLWDV